ncbi:hypothetical protein [Actinophytocola xanthii]|uniref:hypothetical protein n=1 Tax=Actinophytocola xanthii TaxID=1912961 RepID=UPI00130120AA|nr:hypothetical protein [Actinophytocola xanthii]
MSAVVPVVAQRRRNRQFVALQVAHRTARPQALRDLYRDAGSIRRADVHTPSRPSQTSR